MAPTTSTPLSALPMATPALAAPPGETSNLVNPPNDLGRWMEVCYAACLGLCTIALLLRCYVRKFLQKSWASDDWCLLIAWCGLAAFCSLALVMIAKGGGIHAWDLTMAQVDEVSYWFNASTIAYGFAICASKVAILLLYRRVFSAGPRNGFDIFLLCFNTLLILFYMSTTTAKIFECTPRAKIWDNSIEGTCLEVGALIETSGVFNTLTDIIILLIPVKRVWTLQMPTRSKLEVIIIFLLGILAPVCSAIGVSVRFQVSDSPDYSYTGPKILLWAGIEIASCIFCGCLPPLVRLRRRRRLNLGSESSFQCQIANTQHKGHLDNTSKSSFADEMSYYSQLSGLRRPSEFEAKIATAYYNTEEAGQWECNDEEDARAFSQWGYEEIDASSQSRTREPSLTLPAPIAHPYSSRHSSVTHCINERPPAYQRPHPGERIFVGSEEQNIPSEISIRSSTIMRKEGVE